MSRNDSDSELEVERREAVWRESKLRARTEMLESILYYLCAKVVLEAVVQARKGGMREEPYGLTT